MSEVLDGPPEPRANAHLIGHDAAERAFLDAWNAGRMAHAWLLSGPRGIGKATLAYRMARFVLGQRPAASGADLFGAPPPPASLQFPATDATFRKIAALGHPDFRVAEREVNAKTDKRATVIRVEQIRDVISFMHLTPAESEWRVVIVDAADDLNPESANAILKVLEEPPRRAILLLVAHRADRLLPTVRSRCRRLELRPLAVAQVTTLIGRYRPDISPNDARTLAVLGDGSVGRALELDAEGGVDIFADLIGLLGGAPDLDGTKLHALSEKALKADVFRTMTDLAVWWLARISARAAQGSSPDEALATGEAAAARKLAANPAAVSELWAELVAFIARVDAVNVDKKRATINIMTRIANLARRQAA
jgi:DNA polymerase-3 subunit delta'